MATDGCASEAKRRLLRYVSQEFNENTCRTVADAMSGLLSGAPVEVAEELLRPIFLLSDFWPEYMAKQILGLDEDEEYEVEDLLEMFEKREGRAEEQPDQDKTDFWPEERNPASD